MSTSRRDRERREVKKTSALVWAQKNDKSFEPTSIRLPEGVEFWAPKQVGQYKIDIIPYIAGKGNRNADEGMEHCERTYHVHKNIGPSGKGWYICPYHTFGNRCPICLFLNSSEGRAMAKDERSKLFPQQRQLWCVRDVTTAESKARGTMVFDAAVGTEKHPSFGQMLINKIQAVEEYAKFDSLKGGYTLLLTVVEDSWPGGKFYKISHIEMLSRKYDYTEQDRDDAPCLDDCLVRYSFEQLNKIFRQETDEDDVESGTESGGTGTSGRGGNSRGTAVSGDAGSGNVSRKSPPAEEEDESEAAEETPHRNGKKRTAEDLGIDVGDTVIYKGDECKVRKISEDGLNLTLKDSEGEIIPMVSPADVQTLDEEDEPEPVRRSSRATVDEDDDDRPARPRRK